MKRKQVLQVVSRLDVYTAIVATLTLLVVLALIVWAGL